MCPPLPTLHKVPYLAPCPFHFLAGTLLYVENHSHVKRYARYTSENAHLIFNIIVKYCKPINADNVYFIIIQNNKVKRKKNLRRKKCIMKMSDEGLNTGPRAREAAT